MGKSIKKRYKLLIYGAAAAALLILTSVFLLKSPQVQTYLVGKLTSRVSERIKSTISIERVYFSFFNKVRGENLLILDQHADTLIYSEMVSATLRSFSRKNKQFSLGKVELLNPTIKFITDSTGQMNLSWYLDLLQGNKPKKDSTTQQFSINQIDIRNGTFALKNLSNSKKAAAGMIDFNDLRLLNLNAIAEDLNFENGLLYLSVPSLSFQESSGFPVKRYTSNIVIEKNKLTFGNIHILTGKSDITSPKIVITGDEKSGFSDFLGSVRLDISLEKSRLSMEDFVYFVPVDSLSRSLVEISGRITGPISELKGRDLQISYGKATQLAMDIDFSGLPDIENTFMFIDISSFKSDFSDIASLDLFKGKEDNALEKLLKNTGSFSFRGKFTGFTTDFVTYGRLNTDIGSINTDLSLRPGGQGRFTYKGSLICSALDVGKLTGNTDLLGRVSLNVKIDGRTDSFKDLNAKLSGRIDSVEIKGYTYKNVQLDGRFINKEWDGSLRISEPNIDMDLLGRIVLDKVLPEFDLTLNLLHANLYNLNIDKEDSTSVLSVLMTSNFSGNNIDNLNGEIRLLNSTMTRYGNKLDVYDFSLRALPENNVPTLKLQTDFLDFDLRGKYNFASLASTAKYILARILPSLISPSSIPAIPTGNEFTFDAEFKETKELNIFLRSNVQLARGSRLWGNISAGEPVNIKMVSPEVSFKGHTLHNLDLNLVLKDTSLRSSIVSDFLVLSNSVLLEDFAVDLDGMPDKLDLSILWDNDLKTRNKGAVELSGVFSRKNGSGPILDISLNQSQVVLRNNIWDILPASVKIDSSSLHINNVYLRNRNNYYSINGKLSQEPTDSLTVEFKGIDLSLLNYLGDEEKKEAAALPLSIEGVADGAVVLKDVYNEFRFEANVSISSFSFLEQNYGLLTISSIWDPWRKVAMLQARNDLNGGNFFNIAGHYDPESKELMLDAALRRMPINILNPLLKVFASDIKGFASGGVKISGSPAQPVVEGAIMAENGSMKIDYLQTTYRFADSIRFRKDGIIFSNVSIFDERNNISKINGKVGHTYFRDYTVDLRFDAENFMGLNTKEKDNEMFYGTAFATGVINIKTTSNILNFNISAKTGRNTRFSVPLNFGTELSDYSYITFVSGDQDSQNKGGAQPKQNMPDVTTGMQLNFDLDVTPDAEVQLILDSKAGDVMKARGNGKLNISLNPKGDFGISGVYTVEDGDYLFTLGNILNKRFSVESGGTITWDGSVTDARIDMKAIYKTKASLYDILQDEAFRERIPVECHLDLTDRLVNPVIGFNIYLPTADEETRTYLRNAINTEEEMSRQFLYLLVMNSFYPDPAFSSTPVSASTGTLAVGVTTTEMLTNQLSNWLSQISNDFDIGFTYRPGTEISTQEVEVAFSTQILNDKVVINGNFDVGGNESSSTSNISGAFDVEYKLTEKLRFKVFNRANDNILYETSPYTQGLGIFFRKDFDKFRDLFVKQKKSEAKKEEEE